MTPTLGGRTPFFAIWESARRAMHNLGENSVVGQYRCLECDQIDEFQELVIEHEQLFAEHRRLRSAPFSASEHTEHRRQIAAHAAKVAAVGRERVRCVQDALKNDTFGWDDRRDTMDYHRATPARGASVRLSSS
jgi:hypothetical protein